MTPEQEAGITVSFRFKSVKGRGEIVQISAVVRDTTPAVWTRRPCGPVDIAEALVKAGLRMVGDDEVVVKRSSIEKVHWRDHFVGVIDPWPPKDAS